MGSNTRRLSTVFVVLIAVISVLATGLAWSGQSIAMLLKSVF
jgi:hypothetical protein